MSVVCNSSYHVADSLYVQNSLFRFVPCPADGSVTVELSTTKKTRLSLIHLEKLRYLESHNHGFIRDKVKSRSQS